VYKRRVGPVARVAMLGVPARTASAALPALRRGGAVGKVGFGARVLYKPAGAVLEALLQMTHFPEVDNRRARLQLQHDHTRRSLHQPSWPWLYRSGPVRTWTVSTETFGATRFHCAGSVVDSWPSSSLVCIPAVCVRQATRSELQGSRCALASARGSDRREVDEPLDDW
jgi:hypothetical protein